MGILRSLGKTFAGAAFTTALITVLMSQSLGEFTSYESMKPVFLDIISKVAGDQALAVNLTQAEANQIRSVLHDYCRKNDYIDLADLPQFMTDVRGLPVNVSELKIKCSDIDTIVPPNATSINPATLAASSIFDSIYYKEYTCSFVNCVLHVESREDYMIFLSEAFNKFLLRTKYYSIAITAASLAAFLVLITTWIDRVNKVGWSLFSIGITPYIFAPIENLLFSRIATAPEVQQVASGIIKPLVDSTFTHFNLILVAGMAMLVTGYATSYMLKRSPKLLKSK